MHRTQMITITTKPSWISKMPNSRLGKRTTKKSLMLVKLIKLKSTPGEPSFISLKIPNGLMFLPLPRTQMITITTKQSWISKMPHLGLGKITTKQSSMLAKAIKRKSTPGEVRNILHKIQSGCLSQIFHNFIETSKKIY